MSILIDGTLAASIAEGMSALFYPVTLHKRAGSCGDGEGYDANGVPNGSFVSTPVSGIVDTFSRYRRQEQGIPETDCKIIILQHGAKASPEAGDQITAKGVRYSIMNVGEDPAAATWEAQARKV